MSNIFLKLSKKQSEKCWLLIKRAYQWKTGVYGYNPIKIKSEYRPNLQITKDNCQIFQLINAYRIHGHKKANINPVALNDQSAYIPELDLQIFGLKPDDQCNVNGLINSNEINGKVQDIVNYLESLYCNKISVEFSQVQNIEEREWLFNRYESIYNEEISTEYQYEILTALLKSQAFDKFLANKFVTLKRYGCEGAESQIAFFIELFKSMSQDGVRRLIIGCHHRGRLNVLTGLLKMPPELIFRKVQGKSEFPENSPMTGDVISHLCHSVDLDIDGKKLLISVTKPPSHLEAVCPVSIGETRGWQQEFKDSSYSNSGIPGDRVINVQVHGDAAIMGQGVMQESILMSTLPHFDIGGVVHLVINNQLGFTAPPHTSRGTPYATDISKIIAAPVLHVNGDYPNEVIKATRIAVEYQRKFRKSVFIDLNCFRRLGHNEVDDPTYTNPKIYNIIANKSTVPDLYAKYLINNNITNEENVKLIESNYNEQLSEILQNCDSKKTTEAEHLNKNWNNYKGNGDSITEWDTGVTEDLLRHVAEKSVDYPSNYTIHQNLMKAHIKSRIDKIQKGDGIDWATAETLAFGSLLYDGYNVRICGQDVGRGTFCHRHAIIVDQDSEDVFVPLNHLAPDQTAKLEVANSLLSEEAVLGFEYGFSTISPYNLVIWEAQFGDFFNGAQIHIDTYVSSAEAKWGVQSGLVMLLPHGYDGAGPEHSSARIERFLQLSNSNESLPDSENVNLNIVNPTTPAQYFHLLRRQMIRNYRKPLIVVAPKILIRLPEAVSSLKDLTCGTNFKAVIGDAKEDHSSIRKIIFVSGKHYYALKKRREELGAEDTAIIRVEELSPFPVHQLRSEILKYKNVKDFIWSQEEPQNMGFWTYCKSRFYNLVGCKLRYTGRKASAAPAVGIGEFHQKEAAYVIEAPFLK
ncbi:hypothetical protein O3M35_003789 [Rhynocoris fuscipes]|uniref:Transketolase-like pyrimidine-binding domain-containing protein n=1 Tax=Rhynocoris fuscipes TaxID=488301 RepID=A0AAW1CK60_9HEMI